MTIHQPSSLKASMRHTNGWNENSNENLRTPLAFPDRDDLPLAVLMHNDVRVRPIAGTAVVSHVELACDAGLIDPVNDSGCMAMSDTGLASEAG